MSIEQKIAEILAESKTAELEEGVTMPGAETGAKDVDTNASAPEACDLCDVDDGATKVEGENEDNKRNNVDQQDLPEVKEEVEAENKLDIQEDVAALINGEELSEEFKQKAATIFEAAVMNRVKQEVAKLDEAYEVKLQEQVEEIKEGLVEKVDGYLDYVVEQWMEQNEIALESGMKSEILEGFVAGMKSLFEQHYIEVPEEKFDVLGTLEEQVSELQSKLDEQFASNVELKGQLAQFQVAQTVAELSEGLAETDKEKFHALVEELEFDGIESFEKKAKTIRESYFTNKVSTPSVSTSSVVTDAPVALTEEKIIPAQMKGYLSILDNLK